MSDIVDRLMTAGTQHFYDPSQGDFIRAINVLNKDAAEEINRLRAERDALLKLLEEAVIDIQDWGQYADDYFQKKHDLAGTISAYRLAIAARKGEA